MSNLNTKDLKHTAGNPVEALCYMSLSEARLRVFLQMPVLCTQTENGLQYLKRWGGISCILALSNCLALL